MKVIVAPERERRILKIPSQSSLIVTNSIEKLWLRVMLSFELIYVAFKHYHTPDKVFRVVKTLNNKYTQIFSEKLLTKVSKVDGKYYWRFAIPGFPSLAFRKSIANEMNRIMPFRSSNGLGMLLLGITKKCPLSCEHCYEWDRMHQKEKLSTDDLVQIMNKYQDYGTAQIQLGGGEPMLRIKDVYTMLQKAKEGTDFWMFTSGWKFNKEHALQLKKKGLTGVMISLDHHLPAGHDRFRGREGSFDMAVKAAINAKKAKLVTGVALCPIRSFTNEKNMRAYMELAKRLGVSFVQIFEPKPSGRYKNSDVLLSKEQEILLEKMYQQYNNGRQFKDYPIINYVAYHQRRTGCFGSGDYFFYIDTDGDVNKCPLCTGKICNALAFSAEDTIELLKQTSRCHFFNQSEL